MRSEQQSKAQGILERLTRLEESQQAMMARLKTDHDSEMASLRAKLTEAEERRRFISCSDVDGGMSKQPLLMELNMGEVQAAVQAASYAEQESAMALEEARKVAADARLAAGGIPHAVRNATRDGDVAFGADSEYIVKKVSVNLDEVEKAISTSPLVHVCRAFGRPDSKYGNEVYCAVVPQRNMRVSEPMLVIYAQKHLPTAMVPKRFFFLEDLPSGITRKALADTKMAGVPEKKAPVPAIES